MCSCFEPPMLSQFPSVGWTYLPHHCAAGYTPWTKWIERGHKQATSLITISRRLLQHGFPLVVYFYSRTFVFFLFLNQHNHRYRCGVFFFFLKQRFTSTQPTCEYQICLNQTAPGVERHRGQPHALGAGLLRAGVPDHPGMRMVLLRVLGWVFGWFWWEVFYRVSWVGAFGVSGLELFRWFLVGLLQLPTSWFGLRMWGLNPKLLFKPNGGSPQLPTSPIGGKLMGVSISPSAS